LSGVDKILDYLTNDLKIDITEKIKDGTVDKIYSNYPKQKQWVLLL
jgi:hypothetical protein